MNQKDNFVFYEKQRFSSWLCAALVCSVAAGIVICVVASAIQESTNATALVTSVLGGIVALIAIVALFLVTNLETEVRSDCLRVRLFPFHIRHREIPVQDLSQCYARTYKPIREYGGWGIRYSFRKGRGKAYNLSGNKGVQLVFKNGKRLLIGSQKPDELADTINKIMNSS